MSPHNASVIWSIVFLSAWLGLYVFAWRLAMWMDFVEAVLFWGIICMAVLVAGAVIALYMRKHSKDF